jgi:replicative DNA helicase
MDNSLITKVKNEINSHDFFNLLYRELFNEIVINCDSVGFADISNVKTIPLESLIELMTFAPTTARLSTYLTELKELSSKRKLAKILRDMTAQIETKTLQEIKQDGLKLIGDIEIDSFNAEKIRIIDIIIEAQEYLETKSHNATRHFRKWGLDWLDNKTGGVKPGLIYLAARPGVGKSAFALQTALQLAKQGQKIAIFSLEMDRISLLNRLLCNHGRINKDNFDKPVTIPDDVWRQIAISSVAISNYDINIYDKAFAIEEILLLAQEQKAKSGLDILFLDYILLRFFLTPTCYKDFQTNELALLLLSPW